MDIIKRYYLDKLASYLKPNKVLVIYGPRQVGKTTLVNQFLDSLPRSTKIYKSTGENLELRTVLESSEFSKIIPFFQNYDLIVIDEAQKISNIGQGLKIIIDQIPNKEVIATSSSSFQLSKQTGEPLVGRQNILTLFPISVLELQKMYGRAYIFENLENLLVYGGYPEVITSLSFNDKTKYLYQIRDAYLIKDLLELDHVKNSRKIYNLLRLIAFQIGKEVSLQELGRQLEMSKNTVERYLDLLEKAFVVKNIGGFSRNLRKEITKTSRYYFYDNGVRNALIGNFNPLSSRDDVGQLWENFLFMERLKKHTYQDVYAHYYFWRTWEQKEIDLVEDRGGKLYGYEFTWGKEKTAKPQVFLDAYPGSTYQLINRDNFLDFVT